MILIASVLAAMLLGIALLIKLFPHRCPKCKSDKVFWSKSTYYIVGGVNEYTCSACAHKWEEDYNV